MKEYTDEELLAISTLTSGKRGHCGGKLLQAHVAAVATVGQVQCVLDALASHHEYESVTGWYSAFMLADEREQGYDDKSPFYSGIGERLLRLLQRRKMDNLVVIISETDTVQQVGVQTEVFHFATNLASELLVSLGGLDTGSLTERSASLMEPHLALDSVPAYEQPVPRHLRQPKYGPNHYLADTPAGGEVDLNPVNYGTLLAGGAARPDLWAGNEELLEDLTKQEVARLRAMPKPHPMLIRIVRAVGVVKGTLRPNASWQNCKAMLGSSTLRMELMLFNPAVIDPSTRSAVYRILERPTPVDVGQVLRISPVAGALLGWLRRVLSDQEPGHLDAKATQASRPTPAPAREAVKALSDTIVEETVERDTAEATEEANVEQQKQRELEPDGADDDAWIERLDEEALLQQEAEVTARREQLEREVENFFEGAKKNELVA
jgi:hypothetical protein